MARYIADMFWGRESEEFMEYRKRLEERVRKLSNPVTKKYNVGGATIEATRMNQMHNPNGELKWNGWEVKGEIYIITVYKDGAVVESGQFDNKEQANGYYKEAKQRCESIQDVEYFK